MPVPFEYLQANMNYVGPLPGDASGEKHARYCYHNRAYHAAGAHHGVLCNPVKRGGRCIVGRGNQLVDFEDGTRAVVIRRALRLVSKCEVHGQCK